MKMRAINRVKKIRTDLAERAEKMPNVSKGGKYVLFLGDEGAILIYLKQNRVQSRQFVPDASEHNLGEFTQTLSKDVDAPILLVVDSMDQSFMQQTLPPVSAISINKLIRRRLERDFANNDIKGAILLGREKTGRNDWNFMMVALEKSPQLSVWLKFLFELSNRFQGIYVASVEAEMMIKNIDRSLGISKKHDDSEWKFLITHNKVSGFRQIVLKNGRIIFTRLGQPIGDSDPEVIAGGIEQEMFNTIEYMKRLSYASQNRLDIYVLTSASVKPAIDGSKFSATTFTVFTPFEAAGYLGIEGAAQPTDQFGDVVMAASIGLSKKQVLRLAAPQMKRVDQCYHFISYQRVAAALLAIGMFCYTSYVGYEYYTLSSDNSELTHKRDSMQSDLDLLRQNIQNSKLNVEKASDLIDLYHQIGKEKSSPLPFLRKFEALSRAPVWVKALDWSVSTTDGRTVKTGSTPASTGGNTGPLYISAVVTLEFPQEASDPKSFRVLTKKILSDFKAQFSDYEVSYTTTFNDARENEKLEIRSGKTEEMKVESLEAKMAIKGPLNPVTTSKTTTSQPPAIAVPAMPTP